jgi:hypothetical protein
VIAKAVGVAVMVGTVGVLFVVFKLARMKKRKPLPKLELDQAEAPLLETDEFY